ncbi:hypothetical protein V7O66_00620 [Methanolobus sp. ZRKC3]|uniref:hypothetical protein n=1 Tax=Methanolobus sp. ZRKC3 TaxID=3125786 RepID=UPI0032514FF0
MLQIIRCRDLGFDDDFIVADNDPQKVKEKIIDHVKTEHREDFESFSDSHQEEILLKIDVLVKRGCGCGVLKL